MPAHSSPFTQYVAPDVTVSRESAVHEHACAGAAICQLNVAALDGEQKMGPEGPH
jgi:hypothetical protein